MSFSLAKVTSEGVFIVTCDETRREEGPEEFVTDSIGKAFDEKFRIEHLQQTYVVILKDGH